jgi:hybrid cluster-associated redox disulfide protein
MVKKEMTVGEVLNKYSNAKEILGGFGLHCFGCPMSQMETIEEAAAAHGVELDFMLKKLNEDLEEIKAEKPKKCCKKTTK